MNQAERSEWPAPGGCNAEIVKVRDYGSRVPRDFGDSAREAILECCVSRAFVREGAGGIDREKREATFVLTDPSLDSYGEIIDAGAFDKSLAGFMRNPIVLPEHQHKLPGVPDCAVVGHCQCIFKSDKQLLGTLFFGEWPVGELRWLPLVAGSLRAVSAGFRPVTSERAADGVLHYTEAILKEVSTCPVGANDNALLVNMFVAGQFELFAEKLADAGKVQELTAMVGEMRGEVAALLGGAARSGDDAAAPDALVAKIDQTCVEVRAACGRPAPDGE